jgi:hypothetical protein
LEEIDEGLNGLRNEFLRAKNACFGLSIEFNRVEFIGIS